MNLLLLQSKLASQAGRGGVDFIRPQNGGDFSSCPFQLWPSEQWDCRATKPANKDGGGSFLSLSLPLFLYLSSGMVSLLRISQMKSNENDANSTSVALQQEWRRIPFDCNLRNQVFTRLVRWNLANWRQPMKASEPTIGKQAGAGRLDLINELFNYYYYYCNFYRLDPERAASSAKQAKADGCSCTSPTIVSLETL